VVLNIVVTLGENKGKFKARNMKLKLSEMFAEKGKNVGKARMVGSMQILAKPQNDRFQTKNKCYK
jgi:hypothetical protein